ncbi:MAG: DNA primase [Bacteroidota bacterium]|jgi:hypothetical protein
MSFEFFLKSHFSSLYDSYSLERFAENSGELKPKSILDKKPKSVIQSCQSKIDELSTKISDLSDTHPAKEYLNKRCIPKSFYELLYYADDFRKLVLDLFPNTTSNLYKDDPRIVIPFFNENDVLIGLQGRSLIANSQIRYITIKDDGQPSMIYGLDRFDSKRPGYVVEGPIDSMFLPNCLATANSNLEMATNRIGSDLTLIYDNEPKNKEIVRLIEQSINHNRKVCIWPKSILQKDINDMILSGIPSANLISLIESRTFSGLSAQLEFNQWKKV